MTTMLKGSGDYLIVCANCKKVKTIDNKWKRTEIGFLNNFAGPISHGICHECMEKLYPEFI